MGLAPVLTCEPKTKEPVMAMSADERAALAAWLVELTTEMENLSRRIRVLAVTIREDRPPPEDARPTPDG